MTQTVLRKKHPKAGARVISLIWFVSQKFCMWLLHTVTPISSSIALPTHPSSWYQSLAARFQQIAHSYVHQTLRDSGNLTTISDCYPNAQAVAAAAGRNGVHVECRMVLILLPCLVFIKWFSPISHVAQAVPHIQLYPRQDGYKNSWQSPWE